LAAEGLAAEDDALQLIAKSADGGMRDGLSLLDQVLSFGEGPVTVERVRGVLGLIPDETYGELLQLVAERDARAVFPLVDRLVDAGADLGEFVSGAGETLRAVLLAGLGGRPEGLTEGMQLLIRKYGALLPAADVVRMLGVLTEMESQLRTGGSMRLTVELLLLRWAMMSRTVELAQAVIAGLEGTTVAIRLLDLNPVHAEGIERQRDALAPLIGRYVTEPIRVQVASSGAAAMGSPAGSVTAVTNAATRPARLTEESARQERLQMLRARDPGLNAAVEALDLELLE